MNRTPSDMMVQVIGKLPLFNGISPSQIHYLLSMGEHTVLQPHQYLCTVQHAANHIHILVAGELCRRSADGIIDKRVAPICVVGAVEFLTHKPYSETLAALTPSHVLSIPGLPLKKMLESDRDVQAKIYQNLSEMLVVKTEDEADRKAREEEERKRYDARIQALEDQLKAMDEKVTEMMGLLLQDKSDDQLREMHDRLDDNLDQLVRGGSASPPSVLIVDDQPEFRTYIRRVLSSSCTVLETGSGFAALDLIRTNKVDLVLSDIRMAEMDGCTLLENLRRLYPELPVVAVSGVLDEDDLKEYDFNGFIHKPVDSAQLRTMVANALQA